jgi:bacillopeptidase F
MYLIIVCFLTVLLPIPGKIMPELEQSMARVSPEQKLTIIVHMNTAYPYARLQGLSEAERAGVMKDIALNSQRDVVGFIKSLPPEKAELGGQFWIFNGFHLKATREVIGALAKRDDVWYISDNATIRLDETEPVDRSPAAAEWNIQKVMADSCWNAGYSGDGVILGFVDTGVMVTHEALSGKWLSPYWLDAVNGQFTPYDDNGHGTAVAGVACGGDGPGPFANDIGIAYGAKIIPTKAFDQNGSAQTVWLDSCLQYLADLRVAGLALRAVNNSWGSGGTNLHWWDIMLNLKTIGVLPACAAGSSGPGSGTVCVPASYPTAIATGATDASDNIASFSSRGPAPDQNPWNDSTYWYYPDWDLLKPDVSAPGVNIRTSYNNGGYVIYSGVSFAIPHVTGGTALFCDKDSTLTVADLYYLFRAYCDQPSQGGTYPNMNYGWGRINLWRSMQAISGVEEGETGHIPDAELGLKIYPTVSHGQFNITLRAGIRTEGLGLGIYDITGRTIKSFALCSATNLGGPSALCVVWDGSDDHGRTVPAGVYLIKLVGDGKQLVTKAVISR